MAYPPNPLPTNRTNDTLTRDTHPGDHNSAADGLNSVVGELGSAPSGTFATVQARLDDVDSRISTQGGKTLPAGGTAGQVLEKNSGTDFDASWKDLPAPPASKVPSGGTTGQVLTKRSGTDYDSDWETPANPLPSGATTGQVLTEGASGPTWADVPHELPAGGDPGMALIKSSATDFAVKWGGIPFTPRGAWAASAAYHTNDIFTYAGSFYRVTAAYSSAASFGTADTTNTELYAQSVPLGGASGQVLAKASATDGDVHWVAAASGGDTFRGPWAASTSYAVGDLYRYSGSLWRVTTAYTSGASYGSADTTNTVLEARGIPSGGTSGQVLTKNSATDGDVSWAAPATNAGVYATPGVGQVVITWQRVAGATGYRIYRGGTMVGQVLDPIASFADTTVVNGTTYSYTVSSYNAGGEAAQSAAVSATPAPYVESVKTVAAAGAALTVDASVSNVWDATLSAALTVTLAGAVSGEACSLTLILRQGATAYSVTWPASVAWSGGSAPSLSTASKAYAVTLFSVNGGTTWYGALAMGPM